MPPSNPHNMNPRKISSVKYLLLLSAALLAPTLTALALAGTLTKPGVALPSNFPKDAHQQIAAALRHPDCKFLTGNFVNWHTTLLYGGDTRALNQFLAALAKCPGVTLRVTFVADPVPGATCDWVVEHSAGEPLTAPENSFQIRVNLKSERVRRAEVLLPENKEASPAQLPALTPAKLIGEWRGPCCEFRLAADGTGAWRVKGPDGPLEEPEPFKWQFDGTRLRFRGASAEEVFEIARGEKDSITFKFSSGETRGLWKIPRQKTTPTDAFAKRLPVTFEVMSQHAVLITHCRAEARENRTLGKILEVWKGDYAPKSFEREPPAGYVDVQMGLPKPGDQVALAAGTEFVVFWHRLNQTSGGLRQFFLVPIKDGKVSQTTDRHGTREELPVEELKKRVQAAPVQR